MSSKKRKCERLGWKDFPNCLEIATHCVPNWYLPNSPTNKSNEAKPIYLCDECAKQFRGVRKI